MLVFTGYNYWNVGELVAIVATLCKNRDFSYFLPIWIQENTFLFSTLLLFSFSLPNGASPMLGAWRIKLGGEIRGGSRLLGAEA